MDRTSDVRRQTSEVSSSFDAQYVRHLIIRIETYVVARTLPGEPLVCQKIVHDVRLVRLNSHLLERHMDHRRLCAFWIEVHDNKNVRISNPRLERSWDFRTSPRSPVHCPIRAFSVEEDFFVLRRM